MAKSITSSRSRKSSREGVNDTRPDKPYPGYPLFFHQSGRIARKVKGDLHYFGRWGNRRGNRIVPVEDVSAAAAAALQEFNRQWPYNTLNSGLDGDFGYG